MLGSVHAVDEVAYEMIAKYLDKDKDTLISEMKELYKDRLDISENDLYECYSTN